MPAQAPMSDSEPPSLAETAASLTELARSRADRERLLEALGVLCERSGAHARPDTRALLTDLIEALLAQADPDQRARLVERLAAAAWTPPGVRLRLAGGPVGAEGLARLVDQAAESPGLRAALARHPGLTAELAATLYPFVSEPLRRDLRERYDLPALATDAAPRSSPDESAWAGKLHAAGRLGPGSLLRWAREGRREAFGAGLALLADAAPEAIGAALRSAHPETLSELCRRAGLDRAVVPEVLARVRARIEEG